MKSLSLVRLLLAVLSLPLSVHAQWVTQTMSLKAGWNAVFLHVEASHASLDRLVGGSAPELTPVQEVWRWNPNPVSAQVLATPQQAGTQASHWTVWKRAGGADSTLESLAANTAYLVFCGADYTWRLKGRPVLPHYRWSTSGLNLFGFPAMASRAPTFESYLSPVPVLLGAEIFRYVGGALGAENPGRVLALRTERVQRGQAYWMRAAEGYNHYFAPFEVTAAGVGRADFGVDQSLYNFRIRNLTSRPLTVSLRLRASESAPSSHPSIAGLVPLLLRGTQDPATLTYGFQYLTTNSVIDSVLTAAGEPGSEAELVLGLDRQKMTGSTNEVWAGVVQLTDSLRHAQVEFGTSATVGSAHGLWVGTAQVSEVAQYLATYERDEAGQLRLDGDGAYIPSHVLTNLAPTRTAFPLRLIVHNPTNGSSVLFQQIYYGINPQGFPVVANRESELDPARIAEARRISAAHLPWTAENRGWTFDGLLRIGATVTTSVTNRFNDHAANPFLHTYHPDHDNLDARFGSELPQGAESYTVVRDLVLTVAPPGNDFGSRVSVGGTLDGVYEETIRFLGLARAGDTFDTRRLSVRGAFRLQRVSELPTLLRVP